MAEGKVEVKMGSVPRDGGPSCPYCFVGQCKRHPRQDHGRTTRALGVTDRKATLAKMFNDQIGSQLGKFKKESMEERTRKYEQVRCCACGGACGRACVCLRMQPLTRSQFVCYASTYAHFTSTTRAATLVGAAG